MNDIETLAQAIVVRTPIEQLTAKQRFEAQLMKLEACWIWMGPLTSEGYGLTSGSIEKRAHRLAYDLYIGPIPEGMNVLHTCDNKRCCQPGHLFIGTLGDNNRDRDRKGRSAKWERHGAAKLTQAQVVTIRSDHRAQRTIAAEYGVSHTTIGRIKAELRWKGAGPQ